MRFMMMHKNDPNTEAGSPPPMELVEKMGAFIGEYARSGRFIDGAGLGASKTRTRLVFRNGECTTKRGPYRGEHELPAATLLLKVRTREEAIGQVFILAGPDAPTLNEICSMIAATLQVPAPRWHIPVWPAYAAGALCEAICVPLRIDPPLHRRRVSFFTHHREFDISRARRLLGYVPRVTAAQGIARCAAWYRTQGLL